MNQRKKIKAETIITCHMNADFDCISSMVAARKLYKGAVLIFPGTQEKSMRNFFIQSASYLLNFHSIKDIELDSVKKVVICDTKQLSRVSHIKPILDKDDVLVHVYDHHPKTEEDIRANKEVVREIGATTSILVSIIRDRNIDVTPEEATIMGMGIYEDTGSFLFSSTKPEDLEAAAWLRKKGMDVVLISDFMHKDLDAAQVSLLNNLLQSLTKHNINGTHVYMATISTDHYVKDFAVVVHKLIEMENISVIFVIARMQDRIFVIARSKLPSVDVGKICASLGGGGHPYAASATIKDKTLSQVEDELFGLLYSYINPEIKVSFLMSSPPRCVTKKETLASAAHIMTHYGLKAVPVLDGEGGRCVGILEHQVAEKASSHGLGDLPVSEYMRTDFSSVTPNDSLYKVMEIIIDQRQRLVPVIENDKVIGVVTRTDLINWMVEEPARIPEAFLPERRQEKNIRSLMKNRLPDNIFNILKRSGELGDRLGYKVYAVGGFVRDILLLRPNLDIDLVVEGNGIKFAAKLARDMGGRIRAHKKFQTAVVILPDGQKIDVATARLEYYEHPAALPTVELSSIKLDLFRRDFTINALAIELNPENFGKLVDFFGGQKDIKDKKIRVLHSLSFIEDPTRILRALRFEKRYNFTLGVQTERLIKNALKLDMLDKLSGSRIFHELKLILEEEDPLPCIKRMESFDILYKIHPVLKLNNKKIEVLEGVKKVLDWYGLLYTSPTPRRWVVFFLGLTYESSTAEISSVASRLNLSKTQLEQLIGVVEQLRVVNHKLYEYQKQDGPLSELYFILSPVPVEGILFLMASSKLEKVRKIISLYLSKLKDVTIDITGYDLKDMGIPPGPRYGYILKEVLRAKIDGKAPHRDAQLDLVRKLVEKIT
ncbi:CBS domain-containing protein [Desulfothermus okinawensis JCM 13304]